jgi:hypothetical protein
LAKVLKISKIFCEFFFEVLAWMKVLATFNQKWEKVGQSGKM